MGNRVFRNLLLKIFLIILGVNIISIDLKAENHTRTKKSIRLSDVKISIEKAKELAFKHSKVIPGEARITKIRLDKENRKSFYEIEFFTEKNKYKYNIDADTGKILSYSQKVREIVNNTVNTGDSEITPVKGNEDGNRILNPSKYIGEEKAGEIVTGRVTGTRKEDIIQLKLDDDGGRIVYEGKMVYQNTEYSFKIDALTGDILSWEVDEK